MSFSAELLSSIRKTKASFPLLDIARHDIYVANLSFLYDAVVASEQLLSDGVAEAGRLIGDSFNQSLQNYYQKHLEEERNHLEWLQSDLAALGVSHVNTGTDELAVAMVGSQYYFIKHLHPVALLGYLTVVEGDPVPIETVHRLGSLYGDGALRFISFHAVKDMEHRVDILSVVDTVPVELRAFIIRSADNALCWLNRASNRWR